MIPYFSKRFCWAWLVCLLLLAGFLLISVSSFLVSRSNMRETIRESTLPLTSDNVYSEIQRDLLRPVFIASLMAHDTFLRDWAIGGEAEEDSITRYLNEIKVKYGTVTSFFVSEKTKKYYHAHGLLKTVKFDEPRDEWYFRVRNLQDPYEINVDVDMANADEMTIFINYRVFDYDGNFIGATGVGLTVNKVNNLISRYEAKYERQIYFIDSSGQMVLRPMNSPMLEYKHINEIEGLEPHIDDLLSDRAARVMYRRDGQNRMLHCRYVPELDWYLIVEQSESASLAPIKEQLIIDILLAVVVTGIVAWICIVTIRRNQASLERRNEELHRAHAESEGQKAALSKAAAELEAVNERLHALNLEKDEFLGIVAHDLRNPLNSVLGLCDLAKDDMRDLNMDEFVVDIQDCGEHMLELTQKLIDVSRVESFEGEVETEPVDWNAMIERALEPLAGHARKKKIQIECELQQTQGIVVPNRPDWLNICLGNLISNAVKYTPKFGVVRLQTRLLEDRVCLEVIDSGPGISEADQGKLFGKFVRLSAKPTDNESSSGLGLYIVKKMSERLGMEVQVRSELGQGTCFILSQSLPSSTSLDGLNG